LIGVPQPASRLPNPAETKAQIQIADRHGQVAAARTGKVPLQLRILLPNRRIALIGGSFAGSADFLLI
jgi:hypothetical protein